MSYIEFSEVLCVGGFLSLKQLQCEKALPLSCVTYLSCGIVGVSFVKRIRH